MRASSCYARRVAGAVILALAFAAPVLAQATVATYCRIEAGNQQPAETGEPDLLLPVLVHERFKPHIERNEWGAIGRALADDFRNSDTPVPADMRQKFQRQLDAMRDEMVTVEKSPDPAEFVTKAKGVRQTRFQIEQSATAAETFELFKGTPDVIVINPAVDVRVARELCYRGHAAQRILNQYGRAGREATARALGYYVSLWDNYNRQGYSQYPWELFANGLWTIKEGQWAPPKSQWIIAHPAVAVEAAWPRARDLRRLDIIAIEALGYLSYTSDRRSYRGASVLVTLSASADPGYGGLVHVGRVAKLGYVYHPKDDETGKAQHGAVFSLDLYKMIAGVPQKLQDAKARIEAVRNTFK